jgi:DNA-directed RNA polymerase specialized sigma24 family protein
MKNERAYRKALNYAHRLDPEYYKDLVHDAYEELYRNKGLNMLEAPEGIMITSIKLRHRANYTKRSFMWRGEIYDKEYSSFDEFRAPINEYNPEHLVMILDMKEKLNLRLNAEQQYVIDRYQQGYYPSEIAEDIGTYRQQVNYKIKSIVNTFNQLNEG